MVPEGRKTDSDASPVQTSLYGNRHRLPRRPLPTEGLPPPTTRSSPLSGLRRRPSERVVCHSRGILMAIGPPHFDAQLSLLNCIQCSTSVIERSTGCDRAISGTLPKLPLFRACLLMPMLIPQEA